MAEDLENEDAIEDLPKKAGGGLAKNPWLPVIAVIVLLPVLSFALVEFVFIPRMQSALGGASGDTAASAPLASIVSGGPGASASKVPASAAEKGGATIQLYHFDTMKTNLANPSTTLIIVKFSVQGSDPSFMQTIDQYQVPLTDATLKVLSLLTRIDTQSPGIQNIVKNDLIARFNQVLGRDLVEDLYFVDFVTQ